MCHANNHCIEYSCKNCVNITPCVYNLHGSRLLLLTKKPRWYCNEKNTFAFSQAQNIHIICVTLTQMPNIRENNRISHKHAFISMNFEWEGFLGRHWQYFGRCDNNVTNLFESLLPVAWEHWCFSRLKQKSRKPSHQWWSLFRFNNQFLRHSHFHFSANILLILASCELYVY